MPWKVETVMSRRKELVTLALSEESNMSELCRRAGISRKTGYKWLRRYRQQGDLGLHEGRSPVVELCPPRSAAGLSPSDTILYPLPGRKGAVAGLQGSHPDQRRWTLSPVDDTGRPFQVLPGSEGLPRREDSDRPRSSRLHLRSLRERDPPYSLDAGS